MKFLSQTGVNERLYGVMNKMVRPIHVNEEMFAPKNFEETEIGQSFIINANTNAYSLPNEEDVTQRLYESFIAATSKFLSLVKKKDEVAALVLTTTSGTYKFGAWVEYHENENPEEPGNWSYTMSFYEEDLASIEKISKVKKYLYSDNAFMKVYDDCCYDVGSIQFDHISYMYDSCIIMIDTIIQILDAEAVAGEVVDIVLPGYVTFSVSVEGDEKIFAVTPDGAMKAVIKDDAAIATK